MEGEVGQLAGAVSDAALSAYPTVASLLPVNVWIFFAAFARIGAAFMTAPGFGDATMSPVARLAAAFTVSAAMAPVAAPYYPALPEAPTMIIAIVAGELFIGVFMGLAARALTAALNVAGQIAAMQMGLSVATAFDPAQQVQGALLSSFLSVFGVFMIFVTDLHHLLIAAIADSYLFFAPGVAPEFGGMAEVMVDVVATAFSLGLRLAAPFIVFGIVFYAGAGILARLMPQVQVFFILMPAQVLAGLFILMLTAGLMMTLFLERYEAFLAGFLT